VPAEPWDEGELHAADDLALVIGHHQEVSRVSVNRGECGLVGLVNDWVVARLAKHVIDKQADNGRQIRVSGFSEDHPPML
jgi:hypothetical protein